MAVTKITTDKAPRKHGVGRYVANFLWIAFNILMLVWAISHTASASSGRSSLCQQWAGRVRGCGRACGRVRARCRYLHLDHG